MAKKIGIAGMGAIGKTVYKAIQSGKITGYELIAISESNGAPAFDVPNLSFDELCGQCDLIVEALPPSVVPSLCQQVFKHGKDMIIISASALLMHPEILEQHKASESRIYVPSGALVGIDGVSALAHLGIKSAKIATTKKPRGFEGAPYIEQENIDLAAIKSRTQIFSGNALDAAKAFPANINVAATLSLAGIGPERTKVEIWADPQAKGNAHEITVESEFSTIQARVENLPDPANPKTSVLAAQSIIQLLHGLNSPLVVL